MQSLRVAGMIILAVAGGAHPGFGQQYYFSNSGGTQVWNSASANWSAASGGPYDTTWAGGDAIFEGTAGTVVVDSVFANSLTFTLTGYKLTGGIAHAYRTDEHGHGGQCHERGDAFRHSRISQNRQRHAGARRHDQSLFGRYDC